MDIDISQMPIVLKCISTELSSGNAVEVKMERDNVVIVRLDRRVMLRMRLDEVEERRG